MIFKDSLNVDILQPVVIAFLLPKKFKVVDSRNMYF